MLERFNSLRQVGLTVTMVVADFFCYCLAPLQARPHPAWFYTGDDDAGRLMHGVEFNPDANMVAQWLDVAL